MDSLTLIATLIGQLALIAKDPALGYRGQALTEALALLGTILGKGEIARAELEALADQVRLMAEENREPTKDEWAGLRDRSRAAHLILNPLSPEAPQDEAQK